MKVSILTEKDIDNLRILGLLPKLNEATLTDLAILTSSGLNNKDSSFILKSDVYDLNFGILAKYNEGYVSRFMIDKLDYLEPVGVIPTLDNIDNEIFIEEGDTIEYGSYPQMTESEELSNYIIDKYLNKELDKTGKTFSFKRTISSDSNYELVEYIWNNQKYVIFPVEIIDYSKSESISDVKDFKFNREASIKLSNGLTYHDGDLVVLKVEPLKWTFLQGKLVSSKILFSSDSLWYTNIDLYLKEIFYPDMANISSSGKIFFEKNCPDKVVTSELVERKEYAYLSTSNYMTFQYNLKKIEELAFSFSPYLKLSFASSFIDFEGDIRLTFDNVKNIKMYNHEIVINKNINNQIKSIQDEEFQNILKYLNKIKKSEIKEDISNLISNKEYEEKYGIIKGNVYAYLKEKYNFESDEELFKALDFFYKKLPIINFKYNQRISGEIFSFLLNLNKKFVLSSDLISVDDLFGKGKSDYSFYFETSLFDYTNNFGSNFKNLKNLYIYNMYINMADGKPILPLWRTIGHIRNLEKNDIIKYFCFLYKRDTYDDAICDAITFINDFINTYDGEQIFESFSSIKGKLIIARGDYFNIGYDIVIDKLNKFYDYRRGEKFPYPKEYIIDSNSEKEFIIPDFTTKLIIKYDNTDDAYYQKFRPIINYDAELRGIKRLHKCSISLSGINKITISPSLISIDDSMFAEKVRTDKNFELEFESSFFFLTDSSDCLNYYDSTQDIIFSDIKKITIFNKEFNSDITLNDLFDVQTKEAELLITYVLNKFGSKYSNKFFLQNSLYNYNEYSSKKKLIDPRKKIKHALAKFLLSKLPTHKAFELIKNGTMHTIESYITEFYNERKGLVLEEKIDDKKEITILKNNELTGKTVKEVFALLESVSFPKISQIDINTFLNYGSFLDDYLGYITSGYVSAISKKSINDEHIKKLKNYLSKIKLNKSFSINNELIKMIDDFTTNTCLNVREEMLKLKELNELMLLYINKITELISYLETLKNNNDDLTNIFITSKIEGFETIKNTVIEEYKQISLMVASDFNFQNRLDIIKKTYIPRLFININSKDNLDNKKIISDAIKDINEALDTKKVKKIKR